MKEQADDGKSSKRSVVRQEKEEKQTDSRVMMKEMRAGKEIILPIVRYDRGIRKEIVQA
jgi:hypothetical protein